MSIVSFNFFVFIGICLIIYYLIKEKYQWYCLLFMSIFFYIINAGRHTVWILFAIISTYLLTNYIEYLRNKEAPSSSVKFICVINILIALSPLIVLKYVFASVHYSVVLPMGISFYTLQLIGYSIDIYRGKYKAERNIFKYILFAIFFPHILQGPIARYDQLSITLYRPHHFNDKQISSGFMLMLWGLFLKLVLADQAAVLVNTVYDSYSVYSGMYILMAAFLYSIQLYADFMGCVNIAKGVSLLFGVQLMDNFNHPYFSTSIKDFWHRWHISLSSWLRDYIYIPLGGNRKGKIRKYVNLMLTFLISGFWHGVGLQFVFWGGLHGFYQIVGDVTKKIREKIRKKIHMDGTWFSAILQRVCTFVLVMFAWIFFRADSLKQGFEMIVYMFKDFNVSISKSTILELGLGGKQIFVLAISILILLFVSLAQERIHLREYILNRSFPARCILYIVVLCIILIFGKYGSGYDAGQFIYGGF